MMCVRMGIMKRHFFFLFWKAAPLCRVGQKRSRYDGKAVVEIHIFGEIRLPDSKFRIQRSIESIARTWK